MRCDKDKLQAPARWKDDMNELKMPYGVPMRPTMTHTIVFSLLLLLLSVCPVWGQTYYVKSGGSDSAAGTSDGTAWATISKVTSTVTSGDTVYFRSQDTWTNPSTALILTATAGVTYIGNGYGTGTRATFLAGANTLNSRIVLIGRSNVTFRGFNINLNNYSLGGIYIQGGYYSADVNNTTIDNVWIHDSVQVSGTWFYAIQAASLFGYNTNNTTITNCYIYNVAAEGICSYQTWSSDASKPNHADNTIIRNNIVDTASVGVLLANDTNHATIENNVLRNCGDGILIRVSTNDSEVINVFNGPRNFIVRNNYIHHNDKGIEMYNGKSLPFTGDIYYNVFYNNGAGTGSQLGDIYIRIGSTNPSGTPWYYPAGTLFNIYNNTFYNNVNLGTTTNGSFLLCVDGSVCGDPKVNFKNNIIYVGSAVTSSGFKPIYDRYGNLTAAGTHSNNQIYRASSATAPHVVVGTSTTYTRNSGSSDLTVWEPTAKKTDPLFVSMVTPDFQLQSSSPAINAGVNVGLTTDYLGNAIAGLPDIGAYKFQSSKNPMTPTGLIVQ